MSGYFGSVQIGGSKDDLLKIEYEFRAAEGIIKERFGRTSEEACEVPYGECGLMNLGFAAGLSMDDIRKGRHMHDGGPEDALNFDGEFDTPDRVRVSDDGRPFLYIATLGDSGSVTDTVSWFVKKTGIPCRIRYVEECPDDGFHFASDYKYAGYRYAVLDNDAEVTQYFMTSLKMQSYLMGIYGDHGAGFMDYFALMDGDPRYSWYEMLLAPPAEGLF